MKNEVILKVENLSKQYRLGTVGSSTLSHDLNRFLAKIRGKEDPYLKIGESNDRSSKGESEYVWALKDINFQVKKGEVLGIIGKNGAGKSTLLKILSKVTGPTTGSIKSNGRIASLLEVGTGFHPEMTGKENIFLNGAILGMTKKEISDKLDEIISFSGCERYIDTPVKRYSSGMTVRLAFAVAAHLEPDILIIDEVLAVGDAEFQKKAIGKMQDISGGEGRTVLFVSHNMTAVKKLCSSAIVLNNGSKIFEGKVNKALDVYKNLSNVKNKKIDFKEFKNENIKLKSISVSSSNKSVISIDSEIHFKLSFENTLENINLDCTIELVNQDEVLVFHTPALLLLDNDSKKGLYEINTTFPPFLLNSNTYKVNLIFGKDQKYLLLGIKNIVSFDVEDVGLEVLPQKPGILYPNFNWNVKFIDK
ncbi:ABC transporter ATP-binding protein [Polaribacter sp. Z022]|uniref:ABC transporter ATP-binding protein n=1 Tax=Polaribacter sp. Z022 TaxID=2927125 RepID=UPI002020F1C4|nr:ABC transporter ATP-binding protein [Polaribacter sp. Z022]MCL7753176.1 ABC transporter ATP-binding protein [Polaribacter sp. Z022]